MAKIVVATAEDVKAGKPGKINTGYRYQLFGPDNFGDVDLKAFYKTKKAAIVRLKDCPGAIIIDLGPLLGKLFGVEVPDE